MCRRALDAKSAYIAAISVDALINSPEPVPPDETQTLTNDQVSCVPGLDEEYNSKQ